MTLFKAVKKSNPAHVKLINAVVNQLGGIENMMESYSDICNQGAACGFSGFIYYTETVEFANRMINEIVDYAEEQAKEFEYKFGLEMVHSFNSYDSDWDNEFSLLYFAKRKVKSDNFDATCFLNLMSWYALEEVSAMFANQAYSENYSK